MNLKWNTRRNGGHEDTYDNEINNSKSFWFDFKTETASTTAHHYQNNCSQLHLFF